MFFLLTSFRFCPPLKNDGSGEMRFGGTVNDFLYKRKNKECKLPQLVAEFGGSLQLRKKEIIVLHDGVICL